MHWLKPYNAPLEATAGNEDEESDMTDESTKHENGAAVGGSPLKAVVMRNRLWELATAKHPEGAMLPRWLLVIRTILYPLDTFYWWHGSRHGYDPQYDEWRIHGVRYTGAALRALAEAQGETYRITRIGECVTLERVDA